MADDSGKFFYSLFFGSSGEGSIGICSIDFPTVFQYLTRLAGIGTAQGRLTSPQVGVSRSRL